MSSLVQRAVDAIIRPPRTEYDQTSIPQKLQGDDGTQFIRHPLGFINKRNITLIGSYYHGVGMDPTLGGPCVLYLHGNASSQLEGQFLVPNLCKYGIFVCCFDFAGCGCSGGDYVSLGYFEKEDTEFLLDQLHKHFNLGPFILWGRSMGAATSLLVDYPLVLGRISDSSFTSVPDMCSAIATSMHLPSFFVPAVIWFLQKQVIQHANFDIAEVSPISIQRQNEVPCVFGHAEEDQFIPFEQCRRLYDNYPCKSKFLMELPGGHNSKRKKNWIRLGVSFILDNFCIEVKNPLISSCRKLQESIFHFSSFSAMVNETEKNPIVDAKLEEDYMNEFLEEQDIDKGQLQTSGENIGLDDQQKIEKKKKKHRSKNKDKDEVDENGERKKKKHHKKHKHRKNKEKDENGENDKSNLDDDDDDDGDENQLSRNNSLDLSNSYDITKSYNDFILGEDGKNES